MKHEMPALTESDRKELIEYLTLCVENRCMITSISDAIRLDSLRDKIALASLLAKPEYNVSDAEDVHLDVKKPAYDRCHPDYRWICYPAPPVPAIDNRIEWLESMHTLHFSVSILYVVDGYQIQQCRDGEEIGEPVHGETLNDAIELAIAAGWNTNRSPA